MNESAWIGELIRDIGDRIADRLNISSESVSAVGNPTIRRFSITQRFMAGAGSSADQKPLIAKTRRYASKSNFSDAVEEPRTRQLAEQEYETHRKAFTIFTEHESMSVPGLVDLQKDLATIVMEAVPGESLARSVSSLGATKNLFGKQDMRANFSNAGMWLRTFHQEIAEQEPVAWKRETLDEMVANLLDSLRKDGIGQRRFDVIASRFDQRLGESGNQTLQIFGTIHGDFKPAHVLLDEQRMTVIDFGTTRKEYGAADAGNFLADLACNAYGPRLVRQARLDQFAEAFLAGYCCSNGARTVVNLYCGASLLRLWRKRRQRFPNGTPLRNIDKLIDLSRCRGLLNRSYVDHWFEQTIANTLT